MDILTREAKAQKQKIEKIAAIQETKKQKELTLEEAEKFLKDRRYELLEKYASEETKLDISCVKEIICGESIRLYIEPTIDMKKEIRFFGNLSKVRTIMQYDYLIDRVTELFVLEMPL